MTAFKEKLGVFLKGMAMGGADVIPGVSGGTIAFITGIYEELINSIRSINGEAVRLLFTKGIPSFWGHINGNFLLAVFGGILVSILSLARLITYLLTHHPILLWAFFFGLILGSVYFIGAKIRKWNAPVIISGIIGVAVAYIITISVPTETSEALPYIFLSGFIAICAMILPGISGSFILLLLGKYEYILTALKEMNITVLAIFALGCLAGLLSFSHFISWLFRKFHDLTVALLTGFMIGSLNKVWPWKRIIETRENSKGEEVPILERNVSPGTFEEIYDQDPQIMLAILVAIFGLAVIVTFEVLSRNKEEREV